MVVTRMSWAQSRYTVPGGSLVVLFAFAYGTHRWQQVQHGTAHRPKRQYLLHHELETCVDMFEAAALGDAAATLMAPSHVKNRLASKQPFRAVLNQLDVGQAVDALRLACTCDADEDLVVRVLHIVMYVASLRVIIQAEEASASIAVNGLPKSYLPFDALFNFARIDWEQSVLRLVDEAKLRGRSFPSVGDTVVRRQIEAHFFATTIPAMRLSAKATSTVGWRLIRSKLLSGAIGPVRRNPVRHIRLMKRVGLLVVVEALHEVTAYLTNALQRFVELGALAPLARMVTLRMARWTSAASEERSAVAPLAGESDQAVSDSSLAVAMRPHLVAMWMSTTLQLAKLFISPVIEELSSAIRMDLQTEWSYELGVLISQLDEPMREQPHIKRTCSTAAMKRLASQVADWIVKRWVHAFGRTLGSIVVLAFGQLWLGDRSLPLVALVLNAITSGGWIRVCGLGNVWPFTGLVAGTQQSERVYLLDALDGRSPPSVQPLVGLRLMLQVVADDFDQGNEATGGQGFPRHPHIALICGSSTVVFGEVGFLPLYDTDRAMLLRVDRLVRATVIWVEGWNLTGTPLPLMLRTMDKHLQYVSLNCLPASLNALNLGVEGHSVSNAAAARYLDPEEPGLLAKGAAYIHVAGNYHELFARWRFVTLRTLGLDVVHAYRQVGASLASSHGSAWRRMLAWLQEFQLDDAVLGHMLFALEDLVKQCFLCIVLRDLLPLPLAPRSLTLVPGRKGADLVPHELLGRLVAYKATFQRSGLGLDLLYVDTKDSRLRKARELEELLDTLPLLSATAAIAAESNSSPFSRAHERSIISAARPELSFTDEHLIHANFTLKHGVAFHSVDFMYPGSAVKALEGITFAAKAHEFTAIIGKTGSGKSTIVNLLKRLYRPLPWHASDHARMVPYNATQAVQCQESPESSTLTVDLRGEVTFDGIPLRCFEPNYVREMTAYVPQHPHVVPGFTFAQNIAMFRRVSMSQVVEAGRLAGCEQFILATPLGYDQLAGAHLSGGEKQRIEIARAIVMRPQLLILDEATSKLDAMTEQSVQCTLNTIATRCTMISIAHRLSTLKHANRYVVLHEGRVVQQGTHDELMADDASAAYDAQQLGSEWSYKAQMKLQTLSTVTATKRCRLGSAPESSASSKIPKDNASTLVGRSAVVAVLQAAAVSQPSLDAWTSAHCRALANEVQAPTV